MRRAPSIERRDVRRAERSARLSLPERLPPGEVGAAVIQRGVPTCAEIPVKATAWKKVLATEKSRSQRGSDCPRKSDHQPREG